MSLSPRPPFPNRTSLQPKSCDDFTIAVFCALSLEADAVFAVFDHHWDLVRPASGKADGDPNSYSTGAIAGQNVVLVHMPGMGKVIAAKAAASVRMSFPSIRLALVVGICGAMPFYPGGDILLGDIIISNGVKQHDLGRQFPHKFAMKDELNDTLGRPSHEIRSFLSKLQMTQQKFELQESTWGYLRLCATQLPGSIFPGRTEDRLFPASYRHKHQAPISCLTCASLRDDFDPPCDPATKLSCVSLGCDNRESLVRTREEDKDQRARPMIHFGLFASGDTVIKSGYHRDNLMRSTGAIAFEMESAGVWDAFLSCLVIKGVSDYADSHKGKNWQPYAAASAAACLKAFLNTRGPIWMHTPRSNSDTGQYSKDKDDTELMFQAVISPAMEKYLKSKELIDRLMAPEPDGGRISRADLPGLMSMLDKDLTASLGRSQKYRN